MYEEATKYFDEYIKLNYDITDSKVIHKLEHTYKVVENTKIICADLKLNEKETELVLVIALLHDIGRFEQAKKTHSFREDKKNIDHAKFGVEILFTNNMIRHFIKTNEYDEILKIAILNHSKYKLEQMNNKELLFSKIIRDADKLDSFRGKTVEDIYTMANITKEQIENSIITDKILEDFMLEKTIISKERKTPIDIWISYIAHIYDINFKISYKIIKEKNYINLIIDRLTYNQEDTKNKIERIRDKANSYIGNKCE